MEIGKKPEITTRRLVSGIGIFTVKAINPNKQWIEDNNFGKPKEEIKYVDTDKDGNKRVRLDIFVESDYSYIDNSNETPISKKEVYKDKITMFLQPIVKLSQSGKTQFLNAFCQSSYADSEETTPSWFYKDGLRPAYVGEEQLMNFMKVWANISTYVSEADKAKGVKPKKVQFTAEDRESIFNGNMSKLKEYVERLSEYQFKALVGVRTTDDGNQYQGVYNKSIFNINNNALKIEKFINKDDYNAFKNHDYTIVDGLVEFIPTEIPTETNSFSQGDSSNDDVPF